MAKAFNQKQKILCLMQILHQKTDREHVISMQQILQILEQKGIAAERKSIYDDMETLRQFGFDIAFRKSQPVGYYLSSRSFEREELKLLTDAVWASGFIPEEKADELTRKIKELTSEYEAESLQRPDFGGETGDLSKAFTVSEGTGQTVVLAVKEKYAPAILDIFGDSIERKKAKDGICKIKVDAAVGDPFFGWVSGFGNGVKIVKPKSVVEAYRDFLKKRLKQYR